MKNKKVVSITLLIVLLLTLRINLYASELDNEIQTVEITEEYEQWLDMDDTEKENYIEPNKYAVNAVYSNNRRNINLKSTIYSKLMIANYSRYDLRNDITVTVKNQQTTGQCWAFASNSVIETNIEKTTGDNSPLFSARYLEYATASNFIDGKNLKAYNREVGNGGVSEIAFNFYASGNGPVLEDDFPFENNSNLIKLSDIQNLKTQKQLNEFVRFPAIYKTYNGKNITYKNANNNVYQMNDILKIRNSIKEHILQYGAVTAQTFGSGNTASKYYNNPNSIKNSTAYFCNNPLEAPDHQVTIIGWDDEYGIDNFNSACRPSSPGAYIVLNSWGTEFGENGVYYISYEDCFIEETIIGVKSISDISYNKIYQYDDLGNNCLYSLPNDVYAANVFTRDDLTKIELINQISISSLVDTKCDIYINNTGADLDLSKCIKLKDNYFISSGYHTINLDTPIKIQGDSFAVIVKYISDDNGKSYLPLESPDNFYWKTATGGNNRGFLSIDLENWIDINDLSMLPKNSDLCIKAFTIYEKQEDNNTKEINENEEQKIEQEENNNIIEPNNNVTEENSNTVEQNDNVTEGSNNIAEQNNNATEENNNTINQQQNVKDIKSSKYKIENDFIYGVSPNTSFDDFIKNIEVEDNFSIKTVNVTDEKLYTGAKIQVGEKIYNLIVKGDLNGDGRISITDVTKAKFHYLKLQILEENFSKAMDINLDGKASITDVVMISLARINKIKI